MPLDVNISIAEKAVMYMSAPSFDEYVAMATPSSRLLLRNRRREIRVSPDDQLFFSGYPDTINVLAVVVDDSPDTMAVLPIMAHVVKMAARMDVRVLSDNADLSSVQALRGIENSAQSLPGQELPRFLFLDSKWSFLDEWGPHPQAIKPYLSDWSKRFPKYETLAADLSEDTQSEYAGLIAQLTDEMRIWYNTCLTDAWVKEVGAFLKGFQSADGGAASETVV